VTVSSDTGLGRQPKPVKNRPLKAVFFAFDLTLQLDGKTLDALGFGETANGG
jgi:hypothetical protein